MSHLEQRHGEFTISTDRTRLDRDVIHTWLGERSYWAKGVPRDVVDRSIEHSLCFGVYEGGTQIGFARVVTDYATFAWLADVFILETHRGRGLSKRLVQFIVAHPALQDLRRFLLGTLDAHGLYAQSGFQPLAHPERFMEVHKPNLYKTPSEC